MDASKVLNWLQAKRLLGPDIEADDLHGFLLSINAPVLATITECQKNGWISRLQTYIDIRAPWKEMRRYDLSPSVLDVSTGETAPPRATGQEGEQAENLLAEICDELRSVTHRRMVSFLWQRKHRTDWNTLAEQCGMSDDDAAIKKALQRLSDKLEPFSARGVYLDNNGGTKRVKLVRP